MTRLLVVDDDEDVRTLMEHVLLTAGYEIDSTDTEADALELLSRVPYDLVIADAKLPDGTGFAVADEARENGTKTLVITGYAATLPYGAFDRYDILLKPLRPDELLGVVARHLSWSDAPASDR